MKGRGALELGTLSCLMICFTTSNKFKNTHQHITDKESRNANTHTLLYFGIRSFSWVNQAVLCRQAADVPAAPTWHLHGLQHLHQSLSMGWAATGSVWAAWAEGGAGVQCWVAACPPQEGLSWLATLHVHEQHMKAPLPNWELCKQGSFHGIAPCVTLQRNVASQSCVGLGALYSSPSTLSHPICMLQLKEVGLFA